MNINLSGHHMDLTDSLRDFVNQKMSKLERHYDHITRTDVTLSVEKQRQKAEATLHVTGQDLFASVEDEDMYTAIDKLVDKLDRQVIKYKEKSQAK